LDHNFDDVDTAWVSMRTSWTDDDGMFVALKAGRLQGLQTHNDLDVGDFVLDAMGQRWAGELGSGDYLSFEYFNSDADNATRWLYYRKRTEGQNTILVNGQNQLAAEAQPTHKFESTGESQGSDTVFTVPASSTAYYTTDMSTAYGNGNNLQRGIRFINGRKQVLLQDDMTLSTTAQWRMHTNATVNAQGNTATLSLGGKTLKVQIISPAGLTFGTAQAVRLQNDPPLPPGQSDQPNPGVTVLTIEVPQGQTSLQVLFNPQWDGVAASAFQTPPSVPVTGWGLATHN